jgi:hypothetical protein
VPIIVPFSSAEPIVGALEPDSRAVKGFVAPPPSPPGTYVALGAVTTTRLTAQTAGLETILAQTIAADAENRYYHVRFSCTFHPSGNATFEKAWVLGSLSVAGDEAPPIALSLDPLRSDQPVEITEGFELGVDFKFASAKGNIGQKIPAALIFVEALNEGLPDPSWEFTQTKANRLSGLQRLQMIVRTGKNGGHGEINLLANVARQDGMLWGTYSARFDQKPSVSFDLA